MKNLLILFTLLFSINSFAQSAGDYIDVLHFKDGSVVKGIVLEQILGKSVSIQNKDGELKKFQLSEIEKVSKELDLSSQRVRTKLWMNKFMPFKKGYTIDFESSLGMKGAGFRVYNGYKFSRFAILSLGVGFEVLAINYQNLAAPSLSLNLAFSGEILDKRITPYYQVELGYGYVIERNNIEIFEEYGNLVEDDSFAFDAYKTTNYGGPMGALVFGLKLKIKKGYIKLALDYKANSNFYDATPVHVDKNNTMKIIGESFKSFSLLSGAGVRIGVGF